MRTLPSRLLRTIFAPAALALVLPGLASVGDEAGCREAELAPIVEALRAEKPSRAERLAQGFGTKLAHGAPEEAACLAPTLGKLAALRAVAHEAKGESGKALWFWHGAVALSANEQPLEDSLETFGPAGTTFEHRLAHPAPIAASEVAAAGASSPPQLKAERRVGAGSPSRFQMLLRSRQLRGSVKLVAVLAEDGSVADMTVSASGSPLLVYATLDSGVDLPRRGSRVELSQSW